MPGRSTMSNRRGTLSVARGPESRIPRRQAEPASDTAARTAVQGGLVVLVDDEATSGSVEVGVEEGIGQGEVVEVAWC